MRGLRSTLSGLLAVAVVKTAYGTLGSVHRASAITSSYQRCSATVRPYISTGVWLGQRIDHRRYL